MQLDFIRHGRSAKNAITGKNDLPESPDARRIDSDRRAWFLTNITGIISRIDSCKNEFVLYDRNKTCHLPEPLIT